MEKYHNLKNQIIKSGKYRVYCEYLQTQTKRQNCTAFYVIVLIKNRIYKCLKGRKMKEKRKRKE